MPVATCSRRDLLNLGALVSATPACAQGAGSPLTKLGSMLRLPFVKLLDGDVWMPQKQTVSTLVVYW